MYTNTLYSHNHTLKYLACLQKCYVTIHSPVSYDIMHMRWYYRKRSSCCLLRNKIIYAAVNQNITKMVHFIDNLANNSEKKPLLNCKTDSHMNQFCFNCITFTAFQKHKNQNDNYYDILGDLKALITSSSQHPSRIIMATTTMVTFYYLFMETFLFRHNYTVVSTVRIEL